MVIFAVAGLKMGFLVYYGLIKYQNEMKQLFGTHLVQGRNYIERQKEIQSHSDIWIVWGGWYWFIYRYLGFYES